jgi:hypothetical protein
MGKLPNIYLGGTLIGCQECLVFWVPKLGPVWIHPFVSWSLRCPLGSFEPLGVSDAH